MKCIVLLATLVNSLGIWNKKGNIGNSIDYNVCLLYRI